MQRGTMLFRAAYRPPGFMPFPGLSGHETIADAGFRKQVTGAGRIFFELLPQVPHVYPQIMAVFHRVGAPYLAQQLALGDHFALMGQQCGQQAEFNGRQME